MGRNEEHRERKRRRSRSPSERSRRQHKDSRRTRSTSRSRDRDDRRSRHQRSRSRSPSPRRSHKKDSKESKPTPVEETPKPVVPDTTPAIDPAAAASEEMRKRRERLKAWQEAKLKKEQDAQTQPQQSTMSSADINTTLTATTSAVDESTEIARKVFESLQKQAELHDAPVADTEQEGDIEVTEGEDSVVVEKQNVPAPRWTLEDEDTDEEDEATGPGPKEAIADKDDSLALLPDPALTPARADEDLGSAEAFQHRKHPNSEKKAPKPSKWDSAQQQVNPVAKHEAAVVQMDAAVDNDEDDDVDPLDAFMSDLLSSGQVAHQRELKSVRSNAILPLEAVKSALVAPAEREDSKLQTITLEEILGKSSKSEEMNNGEDDEDLAFHRFEGKQRHVIDRRQWESDVGESVENSPVRKMDEDVELPTEETEEEQEQREEQERIEFMDAIRKAREEEERARESLQRVEQERAKTDAKQKASVGRIFEGEGDIVGEEEVEEKRRSALELLEEAKKGKSLKEVDHSKIEYLKFRKNLYIVPKALAKLTETQVIEKRDDLQIKVRGKACPVPVDSWEQCGLSDRILKCIYDNKLKEPFAIQKQAIPAIMCGRDIIGVAKTGSGKTLAFLLPMFRHIQDQPHLADMEGPIGMVMAPARELAYQIYLQAKKFTKVLGIRVACVYGGSGIAEQIADLKRGSEIVVCTPGRMIEILCMQAGKMVSLKRVTMVVMDEADRMFDMGFEPQIKMILQNIRPDRQTVLFSATFPKQIEKLAKSVLKFPLEIIVGERSAVNKDITQYMEVHEEDDKFMRLLQLLGVWYEKGSVLIFVDKQEKCDQLFQELLKLGYPCLSLHGGKDQVDRDHTLHEFKTGIKTVMVATSVAGRGLDVPEIVCVINYNCPNHLEEYVHRVGRTGRAGRKGTAYTFISEKEDQYAPIMIKALQKAGQEIPVELQSLADSFKEKVDRGEAHYISASSGFVGKGFTFDASELNETQKVALMQKRAYEAEQGLVVDKDDDVVDEDMDDFPDITDKPSAASSAQAEAGSKASNGAAAVPSTSSATGASSDVDPKLALMRAKQIAMQLANAGRKTSTNEMNNGNYFCDELDINDYPVQARRKVTGRNALDDITERTGVAIISRGTYVPPGKTPTVGERRLHLIIEGANEMNVRQAKMEILRALEEETLKVGASTTSAPGRYSVL